MSYAYGFDRFEDDYPDYPDDWQREREYYYDLSDEFGHNALNDPWEDDLFDTWDSLDFDFFEFDIDRFERLAATCVIVEFQKIDRGSYDRGRARSRSKATTLRSWRNPNAIGGSASRKSIVRKMNLRRPLKPLGPHGFIAFGC